MKKTVKIAIKALVLSIILVMLLSTTALAIDNHIEIMVSPNVINLSSNGGSFSIHTDIDYDDLDNVLLEAGEVDITSTIVGTFSDLRGDLVVKCDLGDVKELIDEGYTTFKLTVTVIESGEKYIGSDDVRVISCGE